LFIAKVPSLETPLVKPEGREVPAKFK